MDERKKLKLISNVEIMNTPMKKQRFIVNEMIYPGFLTFWKVLITTILKSRNNFFHSRKSSSRPLPIELASDVKAGIRGSALKQVLCETRSI